MSTPPIVPTLSPRALIRILSGLLLGAGLLLGGGCDDGGGSSGPAVTCDGGLNVAGTFDGGQLEINSSVESSGLNQLSDPKVFEIADANGLSFHFEWDAIQVNGKAFKVTGWMTEDGAEFCLSGTLTLGDRGFDRWTVRNFQLRSGGVCGAAVEGVLSGCSAE